MARMCLVALAAMFVWATSAAARPVDARAACGVSWVGLAGAQAWDTAANWSTGEVPSLADDVCIDAGFSPVEVSAGTTALAQSLTVGGGLDVSGGTLLVGGPIEVAQLNWSGGTIAGSGTLRAGALTLGPGAAKVLDRTLVLAGASTLTGPERLQLTTNARI